MRSDLASSDSRARPQLDLRRISDQNPAPMKRVRIGILDHTMSLSPERDFRIVKRFEEFLSRPPRVGTFKATSYMARTASRPLKAVARDRPHWVIGQRSHRRASRSRASSPATCALSISLATSDTIAMQFLTVAPTTYKVSPRRRCSQSPGSVTALSGRSTASRLRSQTRTYCPSLGARSATTSHVTDQQGPSAPRHADSRAQRAVPRVNILGVV